MTDYRLSVGMKRNRRIKIIKKIIILSIIFWTIVLLFRHWDNQTKELFKTNYCWDSNGEHYVAPNERCNH